MKLPLKWKLRGSQNKYLLRKLAYRYVPRQILDRPKKGFEVPISEWLKGPLRAWADSQLRSEKPFKQIPLDQSSLLTLFALHNSGGRNAHHLLWSVLMLLDFANRVTRQAEAFAPAMLQYGN
jgi:asparagine synthase (glutamine-hydrolysing)